MNEIQLPFVTVITPAYNQGQFLKETIESVLSQDYPNIEYIVINDGSTDNTEEILKEYNGRIRWETQQNMGQTPTINKGWKQTKGEIITWLNSDDTFLPGGVRKGVEYLLAHPETAIVFGDTLLTEADGTPLYASPPQPPFDYMRFLVNCNNTVSQPSTFIRREVIEKVGELDPQFYYFMDWDLWLRAGLYFKTDHITDVLSTYRLHAESKTVAQALKAAPELEYMYHKFFSRTDLPENVKRAKRNAMMNMHFMSAGYYLKGGDTKTAAKMANRAFKENPAGVFSFSNLRKFLYCKYGESGSYRFLRNLLNKK
jgi:glycosyltransferase involved in cell wall biosynthesis